MKQQNHRNLFLRRGAGLGLSMAMALSLFGTVPAPAAELPETATQKPAITKAGSVSVDEERQVTYDEPFASGTAGCQHFRIPALITLQDGTLFASADARWETAGDGGGIDSIASISDDGGKTWYYSFPFYFPDSNGFQNSGGGTAKEKRATTIIDPGIVEGPDGTIYFIADVNPSGSTTLYKTIPTGTGYVTVDNGVDSGRFLALTQDFDTSWDTTPTDEDLTAYPYYVEAFDEDGYAQIKKRSDGSGSGYGVDEWYNLYTVTDGEYVDNLRQTQVNSDTEIQQNAFYVGSLFHVYSIDYIWVITSKDGGRTWEHPRDLTDVIKRPTGENGLLVSPGQGISTSAGDIVIGFYDHGPAGNNQENASMVYSTDNGATWGRTGDVPDFWSSENEIVELLDGTLRIFVRSGNGKICYADITKQEDGGYEMAETAVVTGVSSTSTCNVTAISYSKKINGKQAVIVGCPTGGSRANGKLFVFLVEEDNSMTLFSEFSIPDSAGGYVYSCLTEMEDGTLALLWEPNAWGRNISILFNTFSILDVAPGADIEDAVVNVEVEKDDIYQRTYQKTGTLLNEETEDSSIAEVTAETDGTDRTVTIKGVSRGYTEAVIDRVTYKIRVTDNPTQLEMGTPYIINGGFEAVEEISDGPITVTSSFDENQIFDYSRGVSGSLESFSSSPNTSAILSDMEFTFSKSGDNWRIYNEKKGLYLVNNNADTYFSSSAEDMKATPVDGKFQICKSNGQRYVMFYYPGMNFNSNSGGYRDNYTDGTQEMTLLEKQDAVSESDALPGYKEVSQITAGKKYLIGHRQEDKMILLYPQNGPANQTKLVRKAYQATVTAREMGEVSFRFSGRLYRFKCMDVECRHTETKIVGAFPRSCLTDGYTGDTVCANPDCGILIEEGEAIPAIGSHDWGERVLVKEVTETEDGIWESVCKNDPTHKKREVIESLSYSFVKKNYDKAAEILETKDGLYTQETLDALKEACEASLGVLGNDIDSYSANQVTAALKAAMEALDKRTADELQEELIGVISDVEGIRQKAQAAGAAIRGEAAEEFDAAYQAAGEVDSADPDAIWDAAYRLKAAAEKLNAEVLKLSEAKEALKAGVLSADQAYNGGKGADVYTKETWEPFAKAYQDAAGASADATAENLGDLLKALTETFGKLQKKAIVEQPESEPAVGSREPVNGVIYEVTDAAAHTVKAVGAAGQTVQVLSEITIGTQVYAVSEIDARAFADVKNTLKKVTVGDKVKVIGDGTFSGCKKLTTVVIGSGVTTIGKKAFFGCKKLKQITFKGTAVKTVKSSAFSGTKKTVKVKLPKKMKGKARTNFINKLKKKGKLSSQAKIS